MATVTLTKENFDQQLTENDFVLIDFWAGWCGPCKQFAPIYEQASEKHTDIVFGKVDTEDQQELAESFQITSIPTLMVVRDRTVIYNQAGALPSEALENLITQARDLDMEEVRKDIERRQANGEAD